MLFFFKQKTAYEMRISDWSSDVCSSDLIDDDVPPPETIRMPGRPPRPRLVHPRDLPRRGFGTPEGRAAFIHSIAHIEFNAIELGWDAVYRFRGMPAEFYADWVSVASDEARHFTMLRERLRASGHDYGDFDAHNGRWEMAEKTAHDGLARKSGRASSREREGQYE